MHKKKKKLGKEKREQIMQNAKKIKARENNFSLEVNTAVLVTRGILNCRAKGIEYFGLLNTTRKFPYICPAVGQTKGILTSSVI